MGRAASAPAYMGLPDQQTAMAINAASRMPVRGICGGITQRALPLRSDGSVDPINGDPEEIKGEKCTVRQPTESRCNERSNNWVKKSR